MRLPRSCRPAFAIVAAFAMLFGVAGAQAPKKVQSGKTQVVAKLNGVEITISDLRSEMARIGASPSNPDAERQALSNIVTRNLLARAARKANLHRKPEALRRMRAAEEQALADLYLATAAQPPEPSRTEIEDYIQDNPTLFSDRRVYTFDVLVLPSAAFEAEDLTTLFDRTPGFATLGDHLQKSRIEYSQTTVVQPSNGFPEAIRLQLAEYGLKDNIVIRGPQDTQIMKIVEIRNAPIAASEAPAIARRALQEQLTATRAAQLVESLKTRAKVAYYRASAAPKSKAKAE